MGHKRTSPKIAMISAFVGEADVSGQKTDIAALRSAFGGKADINLESVNVRN